MFRPVWFDRHARTDPAAIRASGLDARAQRDAASETEDAAAGANVRVGGAWVTPGPRAFLGSRRTSDTGALSTSVFVASASTTGDVMEKAWPRLGPGAGATKRLRNLDSRFPMDSSSL